MDFDITHSNMAWSIISSMVDIGVVAYLIYRVLLLIRGTRAQQVLVGLGVLVVGAFLSRLLDLRTMSWILDNFISSFLLIVIVVFQNDIRRGLSRVGGTAFFSGDSGQDAAMVDELSRAAESMAKEKMGAILLVQRDADLTELADTGIGIDALVSTSLVMQIFTVPGPLHDGAVIIQQSRVAAAGVFLPVSETPRLDASLGTRHRAAVGITEEIDAVAIVVSEETGQISFVQGGQLTRDLEPAMLRRVLQRYIGPQRQAHKKKNWLGFLKNKGS